MHSSRTNKRTKRSLNISAAAPRFGSTKQAAGATHIRAFCECAGACAVRGVLTLAVLSALLIAARPAQAQTETVLYSFSGGGDGGDPQSLLTSDGAGNFYGTTYSGGIENGGNGYGTVFELSPNGSGGWNETVPQSFDYYGGAFPWNSYVTFDSAGNLYGTASEGGSGQFGVAFELSPVGGGWTETVLHNFTGGADGAFPAAGLIMDAAGNLYGKSEGENGVGNVFKLSPSGGSWTEQVIYSFDYSIGYVAIAGLTMDAAGNIFGVEPTAVFELSPNGSGGWNASVLHTFTGGVKDGMYAQGNLVLDQAGNLYGTTFYGGAKNYGTVYRLRKIKSGKNKGTWTETILHSFQGGKRDGQGPAAGIVFDAAGNIYSTTTRGGESGIGTVFELAAQVKGGYKKKILWAFGTGGTVGGCYPSGGLILDSASNLYGTTEGCGSSGWGVVFEVTP